MSRDRIARGSLPACKARNAGCQHLPTLRRSIGQYDELASPRRLLHAKFRRRSEFRSSPLQMLRAIAIPVFSYGARPSYHLTAGPWHSRPYCSTSPSSVVLGDPSIGPRLGCTGSHRSADLTPTKGVADRVSG